MKIGFLGLGTMGAPMANNLRKSGHTVTVWNRTTARAEPIVRKGATLATTPRACATGQDLVFACLADEKALDAVLEGPDGALAGLGKGGVFIDTSTAGTKAARRTSARPTSSARPTRRTGRRRRRGPCRRARSPRRLRTVAAPPS